MSEDLVKRSDAAEVVYKALKTPPLKGVLTDTMSLAIALVRDISSADRPQGEWIRTGRTNIYGGIEVQCSNCRDKVMVQHLEDEWYCRHCGADMGMKGADDDN